MSNNDKLDNHDAQNAVLNDMYLYYIQPPNQNTIENDIPYLDVQTCYETCDTDKPILHCDEYNGRVLNYTNAPTPPGSPMSQISPTPPPFPNLLIIDDESQSYFLELSKENTLLKDTMITIENENTTTYIDGYKCGFLHGGIISSLTFGVIFIAGFFIKRINK